MQFAACDQPGLVALGAAIEVALREPAPRIND